MMVNNIIIFTKKRLSNERRIKKETNFLSKKKWNILKIYIVYFVYFNNIHLIKLCQIIICATNALKA